MQTFLYNIKIKYLKIIVLHQKTISCPSNSGKIKDANQVILRMHNSNQIHTHTNTQNPLKENILCAAIISCNLIINLWG